MVCFDEGKVDEVVEQEHQANAQSEESRKLVVIGKSKQKTDGSPIQNRNCHIAASNEIGLKLLLKFAKTLRTGICDHKCHEYESCKRHDRCNNVHSVHVVASISIVYGE